MLLLDHRARSRYIQLGTVAITEGWLTDYLAVPQALFMHNLTAIHWLLGDSIRVGNRFHCQYEARDAYFQHLGSGTFDVVYQGNKWSSFNCNTSYD